MSNWWKRFFGLEDEEGESRFPTDERIREDSRRKTQGRFEDPNRQIDVKVLHKYPDQGSPNQRTSETPLYPTTERFRESRGGREARPKRNEWDESPAFIRRSLREDIKPVFEKKAVERKRSGTGTPVDKKKSIPAPRKARFAPTTVASPVYGYRTRPIPPAERNPHVIEEKPPIREHVAVTPTELPSFTVSTYEINRSYFGKNPPIRERESVTPAEQPSIEKFSPEINRSSFEKNPPIREREALTPAEQPSIEKSSPEINWSPIEDKPPIREREAVTPAEQSSFASSSPEISRSPIKEKPTIREHEALTLVKQPSFASSSSEISRSPIEDKPPIREFASEGLVEQPNIEASSTEINKSYIEESQTPVEPPMLSTPFEAAPPSFYGTIEEATYLEESKNGNGETEPPVVEFSPTPTKVEESPTKEEPEFVEEKKARPFNLLDPGQASPSKEGSHFHREPPRKSAIPYNVMMTRSDQLAIRTPEKPPARRLSLGLLNTAPGPSSEDDLDWIEQKKAELSESLDNFNVRADVLNHVQGPTVTRFEIRLHPGVKVNKVIGLTEDLKLTLSAKQIRIAPVPGKNTVGIEIPNQTRKPVFLKSLLQSTAYQEGKSPLTAVLGQDITGQHVVTDLAKMPHGLIAGATGSGKSVCIHSLILSLIYKASPEDLRLILIDPKVVELATYREMPHLAAPVITQPREAALALKWAVNEMERRYQLFADTGVRDLSRYNELVQDGKAKGQKIPYIVIIIDELADLMMTSPQDVEAAICRIAQKARAAGIHMLLATQRPSVDVITGLIKSNIPTRIAFGVSSQADSRTILDMSGAERLLGQGDMLFSENGSRSLHRLQGTFVTDEEIERITDTFHQLEGPEYLFDVSDLQEKQAWDEEEDDLFEEAGYFVIEQGQASVSSLQRRFRIGYNRAARLVDQLEAAAIITEANGSKPRQVLVDKGTFEQSYGNGEKTQI